MFGKTVFVIQMDLSAVIQMFYVAGREYLHRISRMSGIEHE